MSTFNSFYEWLQSLPLAYQLAVVAAFAVFMISPVGRALIAIVVWAFKFVLEVIWFLRVPIAVGALAAFTWWWLAT